MQVKTLSSFDQFNEHKPAGHNLDNLWQFNWQARILTCQIIGKLGEKSNRELILEATL